ncbi:AraC family transcriptional regulator [Mucilaginibacter terrae]|uniref:AraC-like DNA-binding protein n=1 Tax=Mucilaginibacter terrae TaxID=1955052 RepID=A0ABU3GUG5_9SPHI|nr:AraC family transcriptional regulator [Mucilaginibacter terrae]MDT3403101.1 AraC-like DNA-binding protein [Mucilaginibacter terrae]
MSTDQNFKTDGFEGQRAIVIPNNVLAKFCKENDVIKNGYLTDVGYYPKAKFHKRERTTGATQNILIYCVDGKGTADIGTNQYQVSPGTFIIIPRGVKHAYLSSEQSPWTIYWCHFVGPQTDELFRLIYQKEESYKYDVEFVEDRIQLFDRLYSFLEQGYSTENLTYVNLLMMQYLGSFVFRDRFATSFDKATTSLVDRSIAFMQENINQPLTLFAIATSVNVSTSHYSSLFKKRTGFSPIDYFNHLKIQKACQYLQFTQLRIREIALEVGINDPLYFSRLFTQTMGYGPKEYRKNRLAVK